MSWKVTLAALALAVLAACSKSNQGISVNAKADAGGGAPAGGTSLDLGNQIVLQRVRFAVAKVEVEGAPAAAPASPAPMMGGPVRMKDGGGEGGDDGGGDGEAEGEDGGERELGPFLVDLAGADLNGGIHFQFKLDVPDGTYDEVSFRIQPVSADAAAAAPVEAQRAGLGELAAKGASVVVDGTFQGTAFELAAAISAKQENEGDVVVDANGAALTLNVDPSRWFLAADGTALDPSKPENAAAIAANVRASIHVENDDDHHGG